jgi:hypothetical protein
VDFFLVGDVLGAAFVAAAFFFTAAAFFFTVAAFFFRDAFFFGAACFFVAVFFRVGALAAAVFLRDAGLFFG